MSQTESVEIDPVVERDGTTPTGPDLTVRLPDGTDIAGDRPILVIGPNGSGKTRQARQIASPAGLVVAFVNALRNTRVTTEVPAMGLTNARTNLANQGQQARNRYWELADDFDLLLARLHGEDAAAAISYRDEARTLGALPAGTTSSMERLQRIWAKVFPGRSLWWNENVPMVRSSVPGSEPQYMGHFMSDGEKAALYLAGKVLTAEPGILVVDEPETHFHSLLAIRLWNELEQIRPDLRLVYLTHDLAFALSRRGATFVLASPVPPLMRVVDPLASLPADVVEALLGAATFSFYARRLVLCEGEAESLDIDFYEAWFKGYDTVVRPLGSGEMVIRAAGVLKESTLVVGLEIVGLIDRDFHSDAMLANLPDAIVALPVHEIESLYCVPGVVSAVARHLGKASTFDADRYVKRIRDAISDTERHKVIIERWKRRVEGPMLQLVANVASRTTDLATVIADVPSVFDQSNWTFSPADLLADERRSVEAIVPDGPFDDVLRLMPGKSRISLAADEVGLSKDDYIRLVNRALRGDAGLEALGPEIEAALTTYLPARTKPAGEAPDGQ